MKRFEEDLQRLRHKLGVEIRYNHSLKDYELFDIGDLSLFDLPQTALEALAFLEETFEPETPHFSKVQALISAILPLLSPERRKQIRRKSSLSIDLHQSDEVSISEKVWQLLERAYLGRHVLEFDYQSPLQDDGLPRTHLIEPRKIYFDTARRH